MRNGFEFASFICVNEFNMRTEWEMRQNDTLRV